MNPITDLNFWLYLGNLFAATAIALFAIKSGYFDNKLNNMYDVSVKLTEFSEEIEDIYKELYGEDINKSDYNWEYGSSILGDNLSKISKVSIDRLLRSVKRMEPEDYRELLSSRIKDFMSYVDNIFIPKMHDRSTPYVSLIQLNDLKKTVFKDFLNIDIFSKKFLTQLNKETSAAIQANDTEYKSMSSKKKKLDGYISDERMLYLFAAGIAIQFSSLFAPPIIITTVVAFSPAIIIAIKCLHLLFDEIKPFYKKVIAEEDKHKNQETDKASK